MCLTMQPCIKEAKYQYSVLFVWNYRLITRLEYLVPTDRNIMLERIYVHCDLLSRPYHDATVVHLAPDKDLMQTYSIGLSAQNIRDCQHQRSNWNTLLFNDHFSIAVDNLLITHSSVRNWLLDYWLTRYNSNKWLLIYFHYSKQATTIVTWLGIGLKNLIW